MTAALAANEATKSPPPPATAPAAQPPAAGPAPLPHVPPGYGTNKTAPEKPVKKIDLNNASKAELMTLPSVGEAEATKIIANRPYTGKSDLVTKAGLPEGLYFAVRHNVVVGDMKKTAPKKPAPQK